MPNKTAVPASITLGRGTPAQRVFRIVTDGNTLAQDVWIMAAARRAGLDTVRVPEAAKEDAAILDGYLTDLVSRVFQADVVAELLAGVLIEDTVRPTLKTGEAWRAYMSEVRDLVATLESSDEKRELLSLLGHIVAGFLSSDRIS